MSGFFILEEKLKQYEPLVRKLASRLKAKLPASIETDDLIQVGMMGLMQAVERYEEIPGATFKTYATQRIVGAMQDELRRLDWAPKNERKRTDTILSMVSVEDLAPDEDYFGRHVPDMNTPLSRLLEKERVFAAVAAIDSLSERDKKVIGLYYDADVTLKALGNSFGVSESRACQMVKLASARARKAFIAQNG